MTDTDKKTDQERIAKFLARAGIASRREAERLIEAGRVAVNGKTLTTPAFKVGPKDKITFDGAVVAGKPPPRLWRYNKPSGLVTSHKDEKGRKTVFEALPEELGRVISVGRLDITSEGLLLLTNDGELARALELPSTGWARRYRARAFGTVTQYDLDSLKTGITIDGVPTGPIEATLDKQQGGNAWISVTIREGKNREVRRALNTLGLEVNRLIRVSYGPFQLGALKFGEVEAVRHKILRDQVGHLVDIPKDIPAQKAKGKSKPVKPQARQGASQRKPAQNTSQGQSKSKPAKGQRSKSQMPKGRGKFAKR